MENAQEKIIQIPNLKKIPKVAEEMLAFAADLRLWLFYAEMGAGKTTVINEVCRKLGVEENTSSPTFSIVNEYLSNINEPIYHFDFYRLNNEEEAEHLGFEEYIYSGYYCFMEWPEKVAGLLPTENSCTVEITVEENRARKLKMVRYEH